MSLDNAYSQKGSVIRIPYPFLTIKEKTKYRRFANSEAEKLQVVHSIEVQYSDHLDERGNVELGLSKTAEMGFWIAPRRPLPFKEECGRISYDFIFGPLTEEEISPCENAARIEGVTKHNRKLMREKGLPWTITINTSEFANPNDILREEAFFHEIGHLYFHNRMFEEKGRIRYLSKDEQGEGEKFAQEFSRKRMIDLYGEDIIDTIE